MLSQNSIKLCMTIYFYRSEEQSSELSEFEPMIEYYNYMLYFFEVTRLFPEAIQNMNS